MEPVDMYLNKEVGLGSILGRTVIDSEIIPTHESGWSEGTALFRAIGI